MKTLHASLHAAILARRDHPDDMASLEAAGIEPIDLVVCNLYPFRSVAARRGVSEAEVIANIDIGGPTMVRAAAKNFHSVAVVTEPDRYGFMLDELNSAGGELSLDTRRDLAGEAFSHVASYDAAVAAWFTDTEPFPDRLTIDLVKVGDLAYGENPHQRAAFYREAGARRHVLSRIDQVSGKPLSFNNLADLQAARTIAAAFQLPACAIVKHANPCGVAVGATLEEAYARALAGDPLSAFGARDRRQPAGQRRARRAHDRDEGRRPVRARLRRRRPRDALVEADDARARGPRAAQDEPRRARPAPGAGRRADPGSRQRDRGPRRHAGRVRAGAGQARVGGHAVRVADGALRPLERGRDRPRPGRGRDRRRSDEPGRRREAWRSPRPASAPQGAVLASDGFFPFADGPEAAFAAGVRAIVQPGGSVRDAEVIAAANAAGAAMVFTGRRHFLH